MTSYNHKDIEPKWHKKWAENRTYQTTEESSKPKKYILDMFPYPSGEGLHVGHPKGYIATDVYSRLMRMQGYNVLHPMGWDAFGLPAENYAIKTKTHPRVAVEKNIAQYKKQLSIIGFDYDWSREINTTDPEYYKWTQWIFLKLFEKGLAYQSYEPINWCPSCQTGLANEDLENDGTCERCGSKVEKRPMRQWVLKIREYADRLLDDLERLTEWPEHIKEQQRNWIGKSEGALIPFTLQCQGVALTLEVFTTRSDTLFGATYLVLAPEHPFLEELKDSITNWDEVLQYTGVVAQKTEIERTKEGKEKTGIKLKGVTAINPGNKEEIPIFVADYVLPHYGTGAIMAVPAHDERDHAFARKFNLPIRPVILKKDDTSRSFVMGVSEADMVKFGGKIVGKTESGFFKIQIPFERLEEYKTFVREWMQPGFWNEFSTKNGFYFIFKHKDGSLEEMELNAETNNIIDRYGWEFNNQLERDPPANVYAWLADNSFYKELLLHSGVGTLVNSGEFDGLTSDEAKQKIVEKVGGRMVKTYRLQDWVFSRQRYWGEPIPVIHCQQCGVVAVPEKDLPVELPEVEHYEPTGTGESPLANISEWVNVECPKCGGMGKRETNTMPQWAGSSWYWLRFMDPHNMIDFVSRSLEEYWGPVDVYVGGDHAVRHLIYARFWHKFLYDIGAVHTEEPFTRLNFLGFVLAEDGRKMSKRWGNVINPDDVVANVGADAFRTYEMFMGPFENAIAWSTDGLVGARRFLERVWGLQSKLTKDGPLEELEEILHQTIKKVGEDIEAFKFNTAISQMMIFVNAVEKVDSADSSQAGKIGKKQFESFLKILAPFAPHLTEELWERLGHSTSIHLEEWPRYDDSKTVSQTVTIAVQVGGKVRGKLEVERGMEKEELEEMARKLPQIKKWLIGEVEKVIHVPDRLINFVLKS